MQSLKNILLFRLTVLLFLNVYFKNIFILIFSLFILFLIDKRESIILIILLVISLINIKIPTIGYVSKVKDDIAIINNCEVDDLGYEVGDFIFNEHVYKNTQYKVSMNHLNIFYKYLINFSLFLLFIY